MKEISILDNIVVATKVMQWATESNQDLKVLFLDFEKCYDIVNWKFLKKTMRLMGFSTYWIWWTSTLYENAITCILINGLTTKEFQMERGVGEGCPLAPCFYLLVANVLSVMLVDSGFNISSTRCNFIGWFNFCETFSLLMRPPFSERN